MCLITLGARESCRDPNYEPAYFLPLLWRQQTSHPSVTRRSRGRSCSTEIEINLSMPPFDVTTSVHETTSWKATMLQAVNRDSQLFTTLEWPLNEKSFWCFVVGHRLTGIWQKRNIVPRRILHEHLALENYHGVCQSSNSKNPQWMPRECWAQNCDFSLLLSKVIFFLF